MRSITFMFLALLALSAPVAAQEQAQAQQTIFINNESFQPLHVYAKVGENGGGPERWLATISSGSKCVSLEQFRGQFVALVARTAPVNGAVGALTVDFRTDMSYIWNIKAVPPAYAHVYPENLMPKIDGPTCAVKRS